MQLVCYSILMKRLNEDAMLALTSGDSDGAAFFNTHALMMWSTIAISLVLLTNWITRAVDLIWATLTVGVAIVLSILSVRLTQPVVSIRSADGQASDNMIFEYSRPGVSWDIVGEALIGSVVLYFAAYFFFLNATPSEQTLISTICLLAALTTFLLTPLLPFVSALPMLGRFKTTLRAVIQRQDNSCATAC